MEDVASRAEAAATAARFRDERTVFVKGLRMNLRDGELDKVFAECGGLVAVRLMRDSDGRFRVSTRYAGGVYSVQHNRGCGSFRTYHCSRASGHGVLVCVQGFAYVEFSTDEGLQKAVALNGTSFQVRQQTHDILARSSFTVKKILLQTRYLAVELMRRIVRVNCVI